MHFSLTAGTGVVGQMKRMCLVLALIMLCCGCKSGKAAVPPVTKGIAFTAMITYYNEVYECETTVSPDGLTMLTVRSPEDLSGLKLTYDGDAVTAEYMGLTYTPDLTVMPFGPISQMVYGILRDSWGAEAEPTGDNGDYELTGRVADGRPYRLKVASTGLPVEAATSDGSCRIDFQGVTIR